MRRLSNECTSALLGKLEPGSGELALLLRVKLGIFQIQGRKFGDEGGLNDEPGEPFVVCRNDVPGRPRRRGIADRIFVDLEVFLEESPFTEIGPGKLPVPIRIIHAREEPFALLFLRNNEEELQHNVPVSVEILLHSADITEAFVPDVIGDERWRQLLLPQDLGMNANNEDFFVVAAVRDADPAAARHDSERTPHEVVFKFFLGRNHEGINIDSLGIHAGEAMGDDAVLTRAVRPIELPAHTPPLGGIEPALQVGEDGMPFLKHVFGPVLVVRFEAIGAFRMNFIHMECVAVLHAEFEG